MSFHEFSEKRSTKEKSSTKPKKAEKKSTTEKVAVAAPVAVADPAAQEIKYPEPRKWGASAKKDATPDAVTNVVGGNKDSDKKSLQVVSREGLLKGGISSPGYIEYIHIRNLIIIL